MATYRPIPRKDGKPSWKAVIRIKGPEGLVSRQKTFRRKFDAQRWAQETELAIRAGQTDDRTTLTVGDLIDGYRLERLPRLSQEKERKARGKILDWWEKRLGEVEARKLESATVLKHLRKLQKGKGLGGMSVTDSTRNRYKSALGACYSHAVKQGLIPRNSVPTSGLHLSEKGNERDRWLTDDERDRLLKAVRGTGRLEIIVRIGLFTGARKSEIMGLRWRDVNFEQGVIYLTKTKNGHKRTLPLLSQTAELLKERSRNTKSSEDDLVFAGPKGGASFPRVGFARALRDAKIENLTFHGLRHSAGSWMIQQGLGERKTMELLGHETPQMMWRYTHLVQERTAQELREAMTKKGLDEK